MGDGMGLVSTLAWIVVGLLLGSVVPRLPMLGLPRLRQFSFYFPPHPTPMPVNAHLVERLVSLRRLYWWGTLPFAIGAMFVGIAISWTRPDPLGFGLVMGGGWLVLGRILPAEWHPLRRFPYAMPLIIEVSEISRHKEPCCGEPAVFWEVAAIRCRTCGTTHLEQPRPDLGRRRSDGWVKGTLRLLLLDGRPAVVVDEAPPGRTTRAAAGTGGAAGAVRVSGAAAAAGRGRTSEDE